VLKKERGQWLRSFWKESLMKRQLLALILLCSLLTGCGAKPVTLAPAEDSAPAIAYVPLDDRLPFRTLRRRQLKKALASSLTIAEDEDFASFWPILEENLHERYGVSPVHSLEEIPRLHNNFPRQISLFRVCDEAETLGGCIVYETDEVAHVQYIAASPRGKKCGALDLLFHQLIYDRYAQKRYFDFGISTEHGGQMLNEGLLFQKEGFGARAIMYDVYELRL